MRSPVPTHPTFTILIPVVRPPVFLPFAIRSVLDQSRADFELFIVCDGAPDETVIAANEAAKLDPRIRAFSFPKGQRNGESHRHVALQEARGRFVCQLADDDLWLPQHLEEMAVLLSEFEFGNLLAASISVAVGPSIVLGDFADPAIRERMLSDTDIFNLFGPSQSGYRMDTYRRLPIGWSPAPPGLPSDLTMWRKFLALPGIQVGTRFVLTSVHLGDAARPGWSMERRREEIAGYAEMISRPGARDRLLERALRGTALLASEGYAVTAYHRRQSEAWEAGYRRAAADLDGMRAYLVEVEAARDFHRQQSEAWQAQYRPSSAGLDGMHQSVDETDAPADPHTTLGRLTKRVRRKVGSARHKG